jgi:putative FmdB family regulatory protein
MPLYEYECESCRHRFERIQKFSDPPIETCPTCGGKVQKLLSSPAIQFKGSGWYITDYARKGGGSESSKSPAETKADAKSETRSETKAETKSESPSTKGTPGSA